MTTPTMSRAPESTLDEDAMGQVFIDFAVRNSYDLRRVSERMLAADDVRSTALSHIMMDTGASHLCLPADEIRRLGLGLAREVSVQIATDIAQRRIFRDALVVYEDREALCEAIELPEGAPALLGAIPMEGLGIEPDLQNRRVRKLPMGPDGTYYSA